jgi:Gaa1-like, GPI transamidase component
MACHTHENHWAYRVQRTFMRVVVLLSHPLVLLTVAVFKSAVGLFAWNDINSGMVLNAVKQSIMFSTIDRFIYGNWILALGCILLLPIWIILWSVLNSH